MKSELDLENPSWGHSAFSLELSEQLREFLIISSLQRIMQRPSKKNPKVS